MGAEDDAVLGALAHGLRIDVVHGLRVLDQPALFAPGLEVLHGLVVGALLVLAGDGGEVDFGLGDMQEGLLAGHGEGLFGIQDVIRRGGHFGDQVFRRTDGRKGFYSYHEGSVMWLIVPKDSHFSGIFQILTVNFRGLVSPLARWEADSGLYPYPLLLRRIALRNLQASK